MSCILITLAPNMKDVRKLTNVKNQFASEKCIKGIFHYTHV